MPVGLSSRTLSSVPDPGERVFLLLLFLRSGRTKYDNFGMNPAHNVVPFPDDTPKGPGRRPKDEEEFWTEVKDRKYPTKWALLFFLHMEENDWKRGRIPVKNWKRCMYLWHQRGYLK